MRRTLLLLPLLIPILVPVPAPGHPASYCDGAAYLTHASQLLRFDPRTRTTTAVRDLPVHVNALAVRGGELFALARPGARPVKLTRDGEVVELGPIGGAPADAFNGAHVGAIHLDSWLLLHEGTLFRVDLATLKVTGSVPLSDTVQVGDWAADAQGRLLSLSTNGTRASLVRIDPGSGAVEVLAYPAGLPAGAVFGAVWLLGGHLYAWHNSTHAIYRVDLARPDSADLVVSGLPAGSVDGASCEPVPAVTPAVAPAQSPSPAPLTSSVPAAGTPPPPTGVTIATQQPVQPAIPGAPAHSPSVRRGPTPQRRSPPTAPETSSRSDSGPYGVPAEMFESPPIRRFVAAGAGALTLALLLTVRGRAARRGS